MRAAAPRLLVTLSLAALAAAGLVVPATSAHAGVPLCGGQPATIVGEPGQEVLTGTSGPDVIVSNGATSVRAGRGEDVVCMTNGDTRVVLDEEEAPVSRDTAIGSDGDDVVVSGWGIEDDSSGFTLENDDVILLGSGNSTVYQYGVTTGGVLEGGAGRDRWFPAMPTDDLTIDASSSVEVDDHEGTELSGIESFHLERALPESLTFVGTGVGESIYFYGADYYGQAPRTLDVDLRGGQDVVQIGPDMAGEVRAGTGRDQLRYHYGFRRPAGVSLRLAGDWVRVSNVDAGLRSFEKVYAFARNVRITGSPRSDEIDVRSCSARVESRGGDDRIRLSTPRSWWGVTCGERLHVLKGGAGDDVLVGGMGRDVLLGDAGRDRAIGRGGSDRCVAEVRRQCERTAR